MIAYGAHPSWHYVLPLIGAWAFFWDPSLIRDVWIMLGGAWASILVAWHCGWRKLDDTKEKS